MNSKAHRHVEAIRDIETAINLLRIQAREFRDSPGEEIRAKRIELRIMERERSIAVLRGDE